MRTRLPTSALGVLLVCLCALGTAGAASAAPRLGLAGYGALEIKPRSYCPANHTCFRRATWRRWTRGRAVARASARTSYPGASSGVAGRATFVFTRARLGCGGRVFTRVRFRYGGGRYTRASLNLGSCAWSGA